MPSASREEKEEQAGIWRHILVGAGAAATVGVVWAVLGDEGSGYPFSCDLRCRLILYPMLSLPIGVAGGATVYLVRRVF